MTHFKTLALATTASLTLAGCAMGGPIPSASTPITQSEAQQGAQAHPQLLQEFGGAMTTPQANYVEQIGKNIAVQSGLGGARNDFTVSLLNSSVNNAFAIPGGYIYTTRQLVALMNNEAELAGVLGHEVGHVAARHSQRRQQNAQKNQLLGGLGAILSGVLLGDSGLGSELSRGILQGSQLLTLKFSRSQELEADELGIQYLTRAGYDPRAMGTVLASLAAQNSLDAQLSGRGDATIPAWASTHPDPASRVQGALAKAQGLGNRRHECRQLPDQDRWAGLRRRSIARRDRGQSVHPSRFAPVFQRAVGILYGERHAGRVDQRTDGQGADEHRTV